MFVFISLSQKEVLAFDLIEQLLFSDRNGVYWSNTLFLALLNVDLSFFSFSKAKEGATGFLFSLFFILPNISYEI